MARRTILEIVAGAESDMAAQVRDMLAEREPAWRAFLRRCVRDDLAELRRLRAEAQATPAAAYDMAS